MSADDTLAEVRKAMKDGARLDVVRMFFNPAHKWGVDVYARGMTPSGRAKFTKIILILPSEGETVADVLHLLGTMTEDES